ncbi:hypothetical protein BJY00DRAFT_284745 [Aspergillus carlsbadensis]|nr:hypothetical protein BJY00DRAFT_284745 [Aspergillus carlsbadensis]
MFTAEIYATTLTFTQIYFLPLYFQLVQADTTLQSGSSVSRWSYSWLSPSLPTAWP